MTPTQGVPFGPGQQPVIPDEPTPPQPELPQERRTRRLLGIALIVAGVLWLVVSFTLFLLGSGKPDWPGLTQSATARYLGLNLSMSALLAGSGKMLARREMTQHWR